MNFVISWFLVVCWLVIAFLKEPKEYFIKNKNKKREVQR